MEIHCNIKEILNTDKENHKKNRFYHPERVIVKTEWAYKKEYRNISY